MPRGMIAATVTSAAAAYTTAPTLEALLGISDSPATILAVKACECITGGRLAAVAGATATTCSHHIYSRRPRGYPRVSQMRIGQTTD